MCRTYVILWPLYDPLWNVFQVRSRYSYWGVWKAVFSLNTSVCTQVTVTCLNETWCARSATDVSGRFDNCLTVETLRNVLVRLNVGVFVIWRIRQD
jgi:hypothetical protein